MDADRGGEPGHLLDDGALAEDVDVEPGRFVGGAVAPDGGGDVLIHADTVSRMTATVLRVLKCCDASLVARSPVRTVHDADHISEGVNDRGCRESTPALGGGPCDCMPRAQRGW